MSLYEWTFEFIDSLITIVNFAPPSRTDFFIRSPDFICFRQGDFCHQCEFNCDPSRKFCVIKMQDQLRSSKKLKRGKKCLRFWKKSIQDENHDKNINRANESRRGKTIKIFPFAFSTKFFSSLFRPLVSLRNHIFYTLNATITFCHFYKLEGGTLWERGS